MTRILAVDDEIINRMIITDTLVSAGYSVEEAEDGEMAWDMMQRREYDLIVLDRIMPRMDGLTLLKRIKADARWRSLPVILQTAACSQKEIKEGMEAGAYYYLTKPYEPLALSMLAGAVVDGLAEKARINAASARLRDTLLLFESGELRFRTLDQARAIAAGMATLCHDANTDAGTGLMELLVNAIEHGNLEIGYKEKSRLLESGGLDAEVTRRLGEAPWGSRCARLSFRRDGDVVEFTITDEGKGFDWQPYMQLDAERAFDLHGRGIAMANLMSFQTLEYRGAGNIVVARANASARDCRK
jgi:CheY-like chemotaxis protein